MAAKLGILGDGNVGSALARGLKRAGHEVRAAGRDPAAIRDVAGWGEILILYVLGMGTQMGFKLLHG